MKNLKELLKNAEVGTKLYSPIFGEGKLTKVTDRIHVHFPKEHNNKCFDIFGRYSSGDGEVMLFPSKDNRDWDTFESINIKESKDMKNFKVGDVVVGNSGRVSVICGISESNNLGYSNIRYTPSLKCCSIIAEEHYLLDLSSYRYATIDEIHELFTALESCGYKLCIDRNSVSLEHISDKCEDCKETVIEWKDGYPTEEGKYLVSVVDNSGNEFVLESYYLPISHNFLAVPQSYKISGWFKISEIKPCQKSCTK